MTFTYRKGTIADLNGIKQLGIRSWQQYEHILTPENWQLLHTSLTNDDTYLQLINNATSFLCIYRNVIIGMAFLVPSGNPTDIYPADWCYIRFVSVMPGYENKGIAKHLTKMCLDHAAQTSEKTIALHTSEMMDAARHVYEKFGFTIIKDLGLRLGKQYWLYKKELMPSLLLS